MISKNVVAILLAIAAPAPKTWLPLTEDEAWVLVMNTPAVIQSEANGGCPALDISEEGKLRFSVQARNMCPKSGTGLLGNFKVDRNTGKIWIGEDDREFIESSRLKRLRQILLSAKEQTSR
jgi:hypothetical protein